MPKFSSPPSKPDPGGKPNGQSGNTAAIPAGTPNPNMGDWVTADQAWKQSIPQVISDGGKGVSN